MTEESPTGEIATGLPTRSYSMLPTVGLGGSAGSIEPLRQFFSSMPADSGLAFVVILHLSPDHVSTLAEMFQRSTAMPVVTATDGAEVKANCVYVIPPGKLLTAANGRLRLSEAEHHLGRRTAVDIFFRTLADAYGPRAVAIVLSGADGDGAMGIKRIKEQGGLTIAHDPDEAQHSSMPRAAIATGMVDWVLRVKEMPPRLLAFRDRGAGLQLPAEEGPHPAQPATQAPEEAEAALRDVLAFLRTRTACDFTYYKRATILRRIARRMQVTGVDDLPAYLVHLRTHAGEAGALLQDLLISVTNFFRDRECFEALEQVIPELFRDKGPSDTVRAWVPACATGEEAYSVAILLCEHARTLEAPPQIQVFATDLDDEVVRSAREGFYPETIGADVSEERLRRFFILEAHGYHVRREVRELVLFASHDLLRDSPFSRLDLVSCRNLLIYLNRDAQKRALDVFYFALRPGGRLFLGSSENVEDGSTLFAATDKNHRLYVRRPGPRQTLDIPSGLSVVARSLALHQRSLERPTIPRSMNVEKSSGREDEPPTLSALPSSELHYRFIERLSPPSILVNAEHDIVHVSETAHRFLQYAAGEPTRNLLRAVRSSLRIELRAALYSAAQSHQPTAALGVSFEDGEERSVVDLLVSPADDLSPEFLLVVFTVKKAADSARPGMASNAQADEVARRLEQALETTRAQLRDTIEQSGASTEELKASNEELQAMNEELRSATEELETGREELSSVNEELTTVNQELNTKVDELAHAVSDLQNLMSATAIATVFLDRELRIVRFTPSAQTLFSFTSADHGRPLSDFSRQLDYPEIMADAQTALTNLTPTQREVRAGAQCFLARTLPYRTIDDRIAGVVLTFTDITTLKAAEETAARLAAIVESSSDVIVGKDLRGIVTSWNAGAEKVFGYTAAEMIGQPVARIIPVERQAEELKILERIAAGESIESFETVRVRKDGKTVQVSVTISPIRDATGKIIGGSKIARDISEVKRSAAALQRSELIFRRLAETNLFGVGIGDTKGHVSYVNDEMLRMMGYTRADLEAGRVNWAQCVAPEFQDEHARLGETLFREGEITGYEREFLRPDGGRTPYLGAASLVAPGEDLHISIALDLTKIRESEAGFRLMANAITQLAWIARADGHIFWYNQRWYDYTGTTPEEMEGWGWQKVHDETQLPHVLERWKSSIATGEAFEMTFPLRGADGTFRQFLTRAFPLKSETGEVMQWFGTNTDVDEISRAENALRESNLRTLLATEATGVGIWEWNVLTNQIRWDAQMFRIYGIPPTTDGFIQYSQWSEAVLPEDLPEQETTLQNTVRRDGCSARAFRIRRVNDGECRHIESVETVRTNAEGQREWVIGTNLDVTARKAAEEALRRARDAAEAANQAKDRFLAVLSHELRTPLTPVLMVASALEHDPDLRPDVREDIVMIKRNVELETKLIDDLLDLSRITSGKVELKTEGVDLNETVRQVCGICQPHIAAQQVQLKIELDPDVCVISADPARLQQVLWNVLKNAIKFTPPQGAVRVSTARIGANRCEVRVQDSGIGIPPDTLPRIFDAFEQGEAHITRQFGGLGLGLAISRALVELHGGTIRAESEGQGKGATFIVELPGKAAQPAAKAPTAEAPGGASAKRLRLLLVEDHADTARAVARLLRAAGMEVVAAGDVASAVATAKRESFDLVVSDLGLPDGDGFEIMRAVRARQLIPGIAMSGYGMDEDIRRSREAGFTEHLVKPIAVPELLAAIRRVTETREHPTETPVKPG